MKSLRSKNPWVWALLPLAPVLGVLLVKACPRPGHSLPTCAGGFATRNSFFSLFQLWEEQGWCREPSPAFLLMVSSVSGRLSLSFPLSSA